MKLKIYRGTNEIGGSCVEVWTENTRILLDIGMPLVNETGGSFNFRQYKDLSVRELVSKGILPDIPSAYAEEAGIDGVIISHPHADHYGFMGYLNKNIPVYMGKATFEILKLNRIFLHQNNSIINPHFFEKNKPFHIVDFTIIPYWNDHSAFDAYSFLIEANGKRLFYSGDFRGHGRKENAYKWFTHNAPDNVDCLLMEGTTIGRDTKPFKTEKEIEMDLTKVFRESDCIHFIYTSTQNIDRIVSFYKACLISGKTFVIDVYTANVLDTLSEFAKLPTPLKNYDQIKVLFPNRMTTSLFKRGLGTMANKFAAHKITKDEISKNPSDYCVIVRPSMKNDLKKISVEKGNLIYSMWEGYKTQKSTKEFLNWLKDRNFSIIDIHTSGHADIDTLQAFADSVDPKMIIPIHTFNKKDYRNIFRQPITELEDNQPFEI